MNILVHMEYIVHGSKNLKITINLGSCLASTVYLDPLARACRRKDMRSYPAPSPLAASASVHVSVSSLTLRQILVNVDAPWLLLSNGPHNGVAIFVRLKLHNEGLRLTQVVVSTCFIRISFACRSENLSEVAKVLRTAASVSAHDLAVRCMTTSIRKLLGRI